MANLPIHILCYVCKYKLPKKILTQIASPNNLSRTDTNLVLLASQDPTPDFEDNLQLHSAAHANCDIFLINDTALLKMTFFGKMRLSQNLTAA